MIVVLVATTNKPEALQRRSKGTKSIKLQFQLIANGYDAEHQDDLRLSINLSNGPIVDLAAAVREREFAHDTLSFKPVPTVEELAKVDGKLPIVWIICRVCSTND